MERTALPRCEASVAHSSNVRSSRMSRPRGVTRTLGVMVAKSFILSASGNLGRPIAAAGCQRAHGARWQEVQMLGEFDAAFAYCGAGNPVAASDGTHRIPEE